MLHRDAMIHLVADPVTLGGEVDERDVLGHGARLGRVNRRRKGAMPW